MPMPPYVKLLLKTRLQTFNPFALFGMDPTKKKKVLAAFALLLYGLMMAGYLVFFEYQLFRAFVQLGEPETILALVTVAATMLIVFLGFFYVLSELFFTKDLSFVSALPIPSRQLLLAKLLRVWMGEALIALALCLPVLIMYGIHAGKSVIYYIAGSALVLVMPLLPIVIVTLLSFVLVRLSALWKHREALTMVFSVAFLILVVMGQMQLTSTMSTQNAADMMGQLVQNQQALLNGLANVYLPAKWFTGAMAGSGVNGVLQWLLFAAVNIGALALVCYLLGASYQQLAVRQSEARQRAAARHRRIRGEQGVRTPLRALYHRELKEIFTSPSYALNCLVGGILFPMMILIFSLGEQSEMNQLSALFAMLNEIPGSVMVAAMTAVFALTGSMNMAIATSVSREGKRHAFYVTLPVKTKQILLSKLYMGLTISLLTAVPVAIVLAVLIPALTMQMILALLVSQLFILCTALIGLLRDIRHPRFGWRSETEAIKQNWVAAMSMFGGMAIIAGCGILLYYLSTIGLPLVLGFALLCLLMLLADLWLLGRLFNQGSQAYILAEAGQD